MKLTTFYSLMCLAFMMLGATSTHAQSNASQESHTMEHAQIQATIDRNNAAVSALDIEAILATYEPNAVLVNQPGKSVMGTSALRESFAQFLAINPRITVKRHDLVQAGDIALHTYAWTMAGKAPDGSPIEQAGLSVVVLRKQSDGRWLMVIDNPFGDQLMNGN